MQLTRGGDYGIRGVLYLVQQPGGHPIPLEAIGAAEGLPPPFWPRCSRRSSAPASSKPAAACFWFARPRREITLLAIIEAIEGPLTLNLCLRGPGACPQQPRCPVYPIWRRAQSRLVEVLQEANIEELARAARALHGPKVNAFTR